MCVCFHIDPFFLPTVTQHIQRLCRFFILELQGYSGASSVLTNFETKTTPRENTVRTLGNAIPCQGTGYEKHNIRKPANQTDRRRKRERQKRALCHIGTALWVRSSGIRYEGMWC